MVSHDYIENKLKTIILSIDRTIDKNHIKNQTNLISDFNFDSLKIIELIIKLEEEFVIEFDDEDMVLSNISSVDSLISIITKSLK